VGGVIAVCAENHTSGVENAADNAADPQSTRRPGGPKGVTSTGDFAGLSRVVVARPDGAP